MHALQACIEGEALAAAMMRRGVVEGWTIEIAKLNGYDGAPCRLPKYQSGSMIFKIASRAQSDVV